MQLCTGSRPTSAVIPFHFLADQSPLFAFNHQTRIDYLDKVTNDIQIANQLSFPLPILSYVAPEEVEQSAFGDVARILQV